MDVIRCTPYLLVWSVLDTFEDHASSRVIVTRAVTSKWKPQRRCIAIARGFIWPARRERFCLCRHNCEGVGISLNLFVQMAAITPQISEQEEVKALTKVVDANTSLHQVTVPFNGKKALLTGITG